MITEFAKYDVRELDLNDLGSNILLNRKQLNINFVLFYDLYSKLLNQILKGKLVEFQRVKNPIDGEISYNEKGILEWIKPTPDDEYLLKIKDDPNQYWLSNKSSGFYPMVKVYNSPKIDIEEQIDMIIQTNKYNI